LIHARRPTVTSAIGRLREAGLVSQRQDGAWVLRGPNSANGAQGQDGVAMPVLGEMLERGVGPRTTQTPKSKADARVAAMRELRATLAEQRATLEAAAARHREMLDRLRRESSRLAAGSDSTE
jgi:DNA-binding transcriptional ArsR family regulator